MWGGARQIECSTAQQTDNKHTSHLWIRDVRDASGNQVVVESSGGDEEKSGCLGGHFFPSRNVEKREPGIRFCLYTEVELCRQFLDAHYWCRNFSRGKWQII